ncbi:sodium:pantothenate symporter [Bacillus sp. LL01]|uniref:YhdT family protein n=1 Tax=Bacillus sp. LL01 TaxID=1665556 RepID=UPI00064D4FD1|nr:YhdT family protein [Bacillus sp. LL01]KMJ58429.1 sodium:pantothenate symporter [Bacillus sp. LL01]
MDKKLKRNTKRDWRYPIAHKEAWIGIALVIFHFAWWYGFAYGFGTQPVESYTYVFGFPAWFFYSCIVGFIVIILIVITVVKFLFEDIPLESDEKGDPS